MYYQHHIAFKTKNQVCEIYQELCKEYDEVTPYVDLKVVVNITVTFYVKTKKNRMIMMKST